MKKLFFFVVIFFCSLLFSQNIKQRLPFFFNYIVVPQEQGNKCIISYKIPFNRLVFVKDQNSFKTGVSISFEIKKDSMIERAFDERVFYTDNYENTLSPNLFLEGIVKTNLEEGKYKIIPSIELHHTNISAPLGEAVIIVEKDESTFLKPFVVKKGKHFCEEDEVYLLTNFRGNISYSNPDSKLLFPVRNFSPDSIKITIVQDEKEVFDTLLTKSYKGEIDITVCDNKIVLPKINSGDISFYELTNFSDKVSEGKFEVQMETGEKKKSFALESEWIDKPRSLRNLTLAVRALRIIDEDKNFHNEFNDEEYKDLIEFWKKYDPTPETEFNELMNEFYTRVDYSIKKFSTLKSFDGAFTDRGKVYVKFGKPDKIDRNYNKRNETIEIWIYAEQNTQFVFKDISGTGDFKIIE